VSPARCLLEQERLPIRSRTHAARLSARARKFTIFSDEMQIVEIGTHFRKVQHERHPAGWGLHTVERPAAQADHAGIDPTDEGCVTGQVRVLAGEFEHGIVAAVLVLLVRPVEAASGLTAVDIGFHSRV
jgi:hypothetical protein